MRIGADVSGQPLQAPDISPIQRNIGRCEETTRPIRPQWVDANRHRAVQTGIGSKKGTTIRRVPPGGNASARRATQGDNASHSLAMARCQQTSGRCKQRPAPRREQRHAARFPETMQAYIGPMYQYRRLMQANIGAMQAPLKRCLLTSIRCTQTSRQCKRTRSDAPVPEAV